MTPGYETELQRRRWYALAIMSIGSFMTPFDASIVAVALPAMGADLHLSYSQGLWAQAAYLLVASMLLIPIGRLADSRGPVRYYLIGTGIFAARFDSGRTRAQRCPDDPRALHPGRRGSVHLLDRVRDHHRGVSALGAGPRSGAQRNRGLRGPHPGSCRGRPHRQPCQLALDLLHQRPHRRGHGAGRLVAAAGRAARSPGVPTSADPDRLGGRGVTWSRSGRSVHPSDLLATLGLGQRRDHRPSRPRGRVSRRLRPRGG